MQQGLLSRISRSAIMEYHAFGIVSYVSFLDYRCLNGTKLFSQRRNTHKISLFDLWSERRLHPKSRSTSTHPSLDTPAQGTFLKHSVAIMLQIATPVCRILKHLFSLPQRDTCMHWIRNWRSPFNVHSGTSPPAFTPRDTCHRLNYACRTRNGREFLAHVYIQLSRVLVGI